MQALHILGLPAPDFLLNDKITPSCEGQGLEGLSQKQFLKESVRKQPNYLWALRRHRSSEARAETGEGLNVDSAATYRDKDNEMKMSQPLQQGPDCCHPVLDTSACCNPQKGGKKSALTELKLLAPGQSRDKGEMKLG